MKDELDYEMLAAAQAAFPDEMPSWLTGDAGTQSAGTTDASSASDSLYQDRQYDSPDNNQAMDAAYADWATGLSSDSSGSDGGLLSSLTQTGTPPMPDAIENQKVDERFKSESGFASVEKWVKQNQKLAEIIAGAVGSIGKGAADRQTLERKYALEQKAVDDKRRYASDSVKGLRQPQGMINTGPLTYKSGKRVFNDNGQVARG